MKKMKKMLAGLMAVILTVTCVPIYESEVKAAETLTEGDYAYVVNDDGESVTITKYTEGTDTDITIPAEIGGKKVTGIGESAFYKCKDLKSINIPDGVTSIGVSAFSMCFQLRSINIPNSVTSIGESAFADSSWLDNVKIPEGVTSIPKSLFEDCTYTTSINIPDSVTSIGSKAFYNCRKLVDVKIPEGVTSIPEKTFYGCEKLKSLDIPDGVTSIGESAFNFCKSLESINIPDGVTKIESHIFSNCSRLKSLDIPDGVTSIGTGAIYGCDRLTSITIPGSVTSIGNATFENNTNLENVVIQEGVTSIGISAFGNCYSLTSITIPGSVRSIGIGAFRNCRSLKSLDVPEGVTSIAVDAFSQCTSLTSVSISSTVTSIKTIGGGGALFDGCDSLANITVAEGNSKYDSRGNCNAIIEKEGNTLIVGCKSTVIPEDVESIADHAFMCCRRMTEINIPNNVKSIGIGAFEGCDSLKSVDIPDSVTSIDKYAFDGCDSLKSVDIPKGVTSIGEQAFSNCDSLESVYISDGVKNIGKSAFAWSGSLVSVRIPDSVTDMGNAVFYKCSSLRRVNIPKGVKSIGNIAFGQCSSLTGISIPGSVTSIDASAFSDCSEGFTIYGASDTTAETYANDKDIPFVAVSDNDIRWAAVTLEHESYLYDGTAKTPSVTLEMDEKTLVPDTDYTVSYAENTDAGTAKAVVAGTGEYQGAMDVVFNIGQDISGAEITLAKDSYFYDSNEKTPGVTVVLDGKTLIPGTDYDVVYINNIYIGTATATAIGKGGYAGSVAADFAIITKDNISKAEITLTPNSYIYDRGYKTPEVTVVLDGKTLVLNTDYTVSYSDNNTVGVAIVTVKGIGRYTGSTMEQFTIIESGSTETPVKIDISNATVTLTQTSYIYDGTAKTPAVTVVLDGKTLVIGTDYTVSYSDNIEYGDATVTVRGIGSYTGSKPAHFRIEKAGGNQTEKPDYTITCKKTVYEAAYGEKPFKINATSKSKLIFTSSSPRIAAVDKNNGTVTIKGTGIATITVKSDTNTVNVMVKVSPKKASLKTVKPVKGKKLTVRWAKDKNASGYQVQVSTDKNFKKNVKQKNVTKTSYTFTKLKAGKKYYVRVRSYKKAGKETLYGAWSGKKQSGKVKK